MSDQIDVYDKMLEALEKYIELIDNFRLTSDQIDKKRIIDSQIKHHEYVRELIKKARSKK